MDDEGLVNTVSGEAPSAAAPNAVAASQRQNIQKELKKAQKASTQQKAGAA